MRRVPRGVSPGFTAFPRGVLSLAAASFVVLAIAVPASAASSTLYVDRNASACSDSGNGSSATPYCTIGAAAAQAKAGQTVTVASGSYAESVTVKNSGTASAPIVFMATPGANVVVNGGGVSAHGFTISGKSWVTIRGFTVTATTSSGIYLSGGSNDTVSGNHVTYAGSPIQGKIAAGIELKGTVDSVVSANTCDHDTRAGIYLQSSANRNVITGNVTTNNAAGYTRMAPGIDVRTSSNTVADNLSHDNEDSGLQFYTGASANTVVDNVAYRNGDHGIDDLNAPNQVIVGNSVYGNVTAGINLEGSSTGGTVENNISVDNGINSPRTSSDIRVDSVSVAGAIVDHNQVYLHGGSVLYIWGKTSYASLSAFRVASGQEAHGIQADPRWRSPNGGDFHLLSGSPAIDSANSGVAGEPSSDFDGTARVDDPSTPNSGTGPRSFDDRGAFEFTGGGTPPPDQPPVAALSVAPTTGTAPLLVTADASASTDADQSPIATYRFDFGDGTIIGPQSGPTAMHTYTGLGTYTVSLRVTDTAGLSSTAPTVSVTVSDTPPASGNLVGNAGFETGLSGWNTSGSDAGVSLARVAGGHSGSWAALLANTSQGNSTCTLNDSPNWVLTNQGGTYTASLWVKADSPGQTLKLRIREYAGSTLMAAPTVQVSLTTSWRQVSVVHTPSVVGSSLDVNAYVSKAQPGTCFYADDISITRS
jgi:parallel beta-helix repeat protein